MFCLVVGLLVAPVAPALAHGRSSDATNYDSRILSSPDAQDVTFQMHGGDEYLSVENSGDVELLVLGYEDEPWLRVGSDGVFANRRSSATYVNDDRYAEVAVPDTVDPTAEPEWERVSDGNSWYWHDHRTHFMAPTLPPVIREDPSRERLVQEWTVPVLIGDSTTAVNGELWWVPGPSPWPWMAAGLLLSLPALAGVRSEFATAKSVRPAAVVLAIVAVINLVHFADDLFAAPAPLASRIFTAVQTALFIAIALFGALRGWQSRDGAFTALGVGSAAAFLGQGLLYLPALSSSQLDSVAPDLLGRLAIGVSIGQVLPVGLVAILGARRALLTHDLQHKKTSAAANPSR